VLPGRSAVVVAIHQNESLVIKMAVSPPCRAKERAHFLAASAVTAKGPYVMELCFKVYAKLKLVALLLDSTQHFNQALLHYKTTTDF
jgi:hypothetical protein